MIEQGAQLARLEAGRFFGLLGSRHRTQLLKWHQFWKSGHTSSSTGRPTDAATKFSHLAISSVQDAVNAGNIT
jgi:hypothetical protein